MGNSQIDTAAEDTGAKGWGDGFRTFLVVWVGQLVSMVGTNLTGFALAIYVYQKTGSATDLSLVLLAAQLPRLVFTPVAGALVDRWDRRIAMLLADSGAGLSTLTIAALYFSGHLEVWHLFIVLSVSGIFESFQWPAYSAATTLLVDKRQYGRAAGMVQLAEAAGSVVGPVLAATILAIGGLGAVIIVDVATFAFAVATLLAVRFPRAAPSTEGSAGVGSIWSEILHGWAYLRRRPGLLALLGYFSGLNLVFGFIGVLLFPLILGFADEQALGTVASVAGVGMVLGSVIMSVWGGPRRKVLGIIGADVILSLGLIAGGLRPSLALILTSGVIGFVAIPIANASSQAIWQAKVHPDIQGRVFALRRTVAQIAGPLSLILAGPLLDRVFEPLMRPDGALADTVGRIIGTGPGRGAALMLILLGITGLAFSAIALAYPALRNLESDLPDAVGGGSGDGEVPDDDVDAHTVSPHDPTGRPHSPGAAADASAPPDPDELRRERAPTGAGHGRGRADDLPLVRRRDEPPSE